MKKKNLLEFFILLLTINFLIDSIISKYKHSDQEYNYYHSNTKNNSKTRKLQNNSNTTYSSDMYKNICISKNYSYELMDYIDPLSKTLTEVLNFTFIKNTDSSVIYIIIIFSKIFYLYLFLLFNIIN